MKNPLIRPFLLVALIAAGVGARADDKAMLPQPVPFAPESAARERMEAWNKAWERLQQAERESLAAINSSLQDVDGSFATAAGNAPQFVEDMFGWNAKWQFTVGVGGQVVNFGAGMLDAILQTRLGRPAGPDSFRDFARKQFVDVVFDPDVLKRGVDNAATSYVSRLRAIENRLLVDLGADLPDATIKMPRISVPRLSDTLAAPVDVAVEDIIADVAADFGITVAKEVVSQIGGNIASSALLSNRFLVEHLGTGDPFSFTVMGTGFIVGVGVSWAVDQAVEKMGHDPRGKLAGRLVERLKSARTTVIEGPNPEMSSRYAWLALFRHGDSDAVVRSICDRAAARLEQGNFIGLRPMLSSLHAERLCARRRTVFHLIFGEGAHEAAELCLHPKQADQRAAVIAWAQEYLFPRKPL